MSKIGFFLVVGTVAGSLLAIAVFDWWMTWRRKPPLGHRMQVFILEHPWLAGVLGLVYAAMVAHFFLHIDHG